MLPDSSRHNEIIMKLLPHLILSQWEIEFVDGDDCLQSSDLAAVKKSKP